MASAANQKPTCPVCNRSDEVKTMQAAYNSGVARCAPPEMPAKQVLMLPWIIPSTVIVGVTIFLVLVFFGSGFLRDSTSIAILAIITLICIITALVLSYIAFNRIVSGDTEATLLYPAWDKATEAWRNLYYCARNDAIFDPQTNRTLSDAQLNKLHNYDESVASAPRSATMANQH